MRKKLWLLVITLVLSGTIGAQTTEFTFQGKLNDGGFAVTTPRDLRFRLWNVDSGGEQVGSDVVVANAEFSNGIFTVQLDFGLPVFTGEQRWIEIAVSLPGANDYTTLTPRQKLTSAPYAVRSATAASSAALDCALCITDAHIVSIDGSKVNGPVAQASMAATAGNVTGVVQVANGGTGSSTKNFVDLSTDQPGIGGNKSFTGNVSVTGSGKFNGDGSGLINLNSPVVANAPLTGNGTAASPLGIQSPLTVTIADRPEQKAVTITCSGTSGSGVCSNELPIGKRFVVEHVSGYFRFTSAADANAYLSVYPGQPGKGTTLYVQPSATVTLGSVTDLILNSFVKAYYDETFVHVGPVYLVGLAQWTVSLSGYYVDLPVDPTVRKGVRINAAK